MSVSVIIVNYYSSQLLSGQLVDLLQIARIRRLIVVDNSGELADPGLLPASHKLQVIVNERNVGFGTAVNQGIEQADGEWILVINPDVRLPMKDLERLIHAATHYGCPIVGPRFYWDDEKVFQLPPATGSCLWFNYANMAADRHWLDRELLSFQWIMRHERFWSATDPFFEPFLSGACLLVNRAWVRSHGGKLFDERFFLYFEDTDLCVRAIREGIRPLCVPQASAIHYYDQSPSPSESKSLFMSHAHSKFLQKYYEEVSFPKLPTQSLDGDFVDRGEIVDPPVFSFEDEGSFGRPCFEISVVPFFVPFAQALWKGDRFEFPMSIWNRLSPGLYFGRMRDSLSGVHKIWKWKKE